MLQVFESLGEDLAEIVLLGDYLDAPAVSFHGKSPKMRGEFLKDEIEYSKKRIKELNVKFPSAKKVYCEGNHEARLSRYISEKCPELFGLLSIPELLGIKGHPQWSWVPFGPYQSHKVLGSKLIARHCPLASGKHHAKATVEKAMASVVYGHVHQRQEAQIVALDGKKYRAFCPGWLGDQKSDGFQYVQNHAQWSLGFSIVAVLPDRSWFATTCEIVDYKTTFGSRLFVG